MSGVVPAVRSGWRSEEEVERHDPLVFISVHIYVCALCLSFSRKKGSGKGGEDKTGRFFYRTERARSVRLEVFCE